MGCRGSRRAGVKPKHSPQPGNTGSRARDPQAGPCQWAAPVSRVYIPRAVPIPIPVPVSTPVPISILIPIPVLAPVPISVPIPVPVPPAGAAGLSGKEAAGSCRAIKGRAVPARRHSASPLPPDESPPSLRARPARRGRPGRGCGREPGGSRGRRGGACRGDTRGKLGPGGGCTGARAGVPGSGEGNAWETLPGGGMAQMGAAWGGTRGNPPAGGIPGSRGTPCSRGDADGSSCRGMCSEGGGMLRGCPCPRGGMCMRIPSLGPGGPPPRGHAGEWGQR